MRDRERDRSGKRISALWCGAGEPAWRACTPGWVSCMNSKSLLTTVLRNFQCARRKRGYWPTTYLAVCDDEQAWRNLTAAMCNCSATGSGIGARAVTLQAPAVSHEGGVRT